MAALRRFGERNRCARRFRRAAVAPGRSPNLRSRRPRALSGASRSVPRGRR